MVEVPAAALAIDRFDADFYSIGSNDLVQYVTACDRGAGELAGLADPLNPAVLELIRRTMRARQGARRRESACAATWRPIRAMCRRCSIAGLTEFSVAPTALGAAQGGDRWSWVRNAPTTRAASSAVAEYKAILQDVLESRPSGMRQRLAEAIGKNRSFISQISNPSYQTPIPARHLALIFEICHFSAHERAAFLRAYSRAHPRPPGAASRDAPRNATITLALPDLGNAAQEPAARNPDLDFVHRLVLLLGEGR